MLKHAERIVEREPRIARPQIELDRKKLRAILSERFSKTLEYLAR